MSENTKNRRQNRRRHEAHDGDVSDTFCGREFKGLHMMVLDSCIKNPTCGGKY